MACTESNCFEADSLWARGIQEFKAGRESSRPADGLQSFQASLKLDSTDAERHFFVAALLFVLQRSAEGQASLEAAISASPGCGKAYLELVLFLEANGRRQEAREVASRAIKAGARWADEWQRPPIFSAGLTSRPWWPRDKFPWAAELEDAFPSIKAELLRLLEAKGGGLAPAWEKVGQNRAAHDADIVAPGGDWREFIIFSAQPLDPDVEKYLPQSRVLLEQTVPGAVAMAKIGVGEIILSALAPGTHLLPHCASSNVRLTCHLGLVCPKGARLRVGQHWGEWEEGKCLFFDDSYEHEVIHDGEGVRIVLLIRFWHPDLAPEQWMPTLEAGVVEYDAMHQRRIEPPASPAVTQVLNSAFAEASDLLHLTSVEDDLF